MEAPVHYLRISPSPLSKITETAIEWLSQGPYQIFVKNEFRPCASNGQMLVLLKMTHKHLNEVQRYTGNATVRSSFTDKYQLQTIADFWSNNEWRPNAFILNLGMACSALRINAPDYFTNVFNQSAALRGPCEVPLGIYRVDNVPIDLSDPLIRVLPYGKYRLHIKAYKKDINVIENVYYCTVLELDVNPKVFK